MLFSGNTAERPINSDVGVVPLLLAPIFTSVTRVASAESFDVFLIAWRLAGGWGL